MKKLLFVAVAMIAATVVSFGYADNGKCDKVVSPDSIKICDTLATGPQL